MAEQKVDRLRKDFEVDFVGQDGLEDLRAPAARGPQR